MFVADCLQVNKQGHLCMEELDVLELAAKYGTPLYVMSETQIRKKLPDVSGFFKALLRRKWLGFVCQ